MLRSLHIKNYQSHEDTAIEFSENVTLIVGPSNNGKTAILRALRWLLRNRPLGDGFIRDGENNCYVKLVTDNCIIERIKSPEMNGYTYLPLPARRGVKKVDFTAIGSSVPEEILNALNIEDINIQNQLDPYFLVLEPPGKVGSYINGVMHLDEVEDVISHIGKRIREATAEIKSWKETKEKIFTNLTFYKSLDLDTYRKALDRYEEIIQKRDKWEGEVNQIRPLITSLEDIERQIVELPDVTSLLNRSRDIEDEVGTLEDSDSYLGALIEDYEKLDCPLLRLDPEVFKILEEVTTFLERFSKKQDEEEQLYFLLQDVEDLDKEIKETQLSYQSSIQEKDELMKQLTICPYCESELDEEHKTTLLRETSNG
jgi:exonuclease SbcC